MEKMNWIACAQKETDFEKYLVANPEKCPEVQTLYNKVKTWVTDSVKCFATQPKSILDAAVSAFKRENKRYMKKRWGVRK
jgi:thiamine monophosphate synthase